MKYLYLLMAVLLLPMAGCAKAPVLSDTSTLGTATLDIEGTKGKELQIILQDFLSAENAPLTIVLKEAGTGRMSAYELDSSTERAIYLLSSGKWEAGSEVQADSLFTISLINMDGSRFDIPSQGDMVIYSTHTKQVVYKYVPKNEDLFDALRFIFDGYEASPQNVSVAANTDESIAERWVSAYQQYLFTTIPGGANELSDVKIASVSATSGTDGELQVSYDIALKPINEVGHSWMAGGGYSGNGEFSGYIIAPRMVVLEKRDSRWYCTQVLGS